MPVPMKKPRIDQIETVIIGESKFQIPKEKARAFLVLLKDTYVSLEYEDSIPADDVFKDLDAKYTRPGVAIRGARGKEEMTQIELAHRLKITQGDLSKMEHGKRPIGKKMAKRLSRILNIDYRIFL